jgi:hypothetical protein
VRDAFRARGHDAWSCDLEPSDSPYHLQCDVLTILKPLYRHEWDLGIFHPPCTYLSNSSSKHLYIDGKKENGPDPERWRLMREGARFFDMLWNAPIRKVVCENPIMLGYAKEIIGAEQTQTVQPWMWGDPYTKRTCLWIRGLPALVPEYPKWADCRDALGMPPDAKPKAEVHLAPPGPDRWKMRSLTYPGIARAMAEQWSPDLT